MPQNRIAIIPLKCKPLKIPINIYLGVSGRYLCQGVRYICEAQHEAKFKAGGQGGLKMCLQECQYLGFVYRSMYFRTSELNIATSVPIPAEPKNIMKNLIGTQLIKCTDVKTFRDLRAEK